jgi:acyl carrier protein
MDMAFHSASTTSRDAALLELALELSRELHPQRKTRVLTPDSLIEREAGLDSLARVELLLRAEKRLGVRLPDHAVLSAEMFRDLLAAVEEEWPEQLYANPKTLFVAGFLGSGTVLVGRTQNGEARFGPLSLPVPEETPHEEGASVELLARPEQIALSAGKPADVPVLGKGAIIEETFSGPLRRLRLRLPRLPGTRQVSPVPPFGEEGLLVDAVVPAEPSASGKGKELWVSLNGWTILKQAPLRLLVVDTGAGSTTALNLAQVLAMRVKAP